MDLTDRNKRWNREASIFAATGIVSILVSLRIRKSIKLRTYKPKMFEHNHKPPSSNIYTEAAAAVGNATMLSFSVFSFAVAGAAFYGDVCTLPEAGLKLKKALGGEAKEQELAQMPVDEESQKVEKGLLNFLRK